MTSNIRQTGCSISSILFRVSNFKRTYISLARNVNSPPIIKDQKTKDELERSNILRSNDVLRYINDNPLRKDHLSQRISVLRNYLAEFKLSDEVLSVIIHPFDTEQHINVKINQEEILMDVDSIEEVGKLQYDLINSLFLIDRFSEHYGIEVLTNDLGKKIKQNATLNRHLKGNDLLKLPQISTNHIKALYGERARRILYRSIGFINLQYGKEKATQFIDEKVINGNHGTLSHILSKIY